jgi:hypothetical protein
MCALADVNHAARSREDFLERMRLSDRRALFSTVPLSKQVFALQAARDVFGMEEVRSELNRLLRYAGVNYRDLIDRTGPICLRRVVVDHFSSSFEFNEEHGEPAFILAVHDLDAETVIDLMACPINRLEVCATHFRFAGLLGGDAAVNPASFVDGPCPIWANPVSWLRAGLRGCVVLHPELAAPVLDQAPGVFQCEDEEHARRLVGTHSLDPSRLLVRSRQVVA